MSWTVNWSRLPQQIHANLNYSTIIQLSINSKPKASFENTRTVSSLFNTLQEEKVHNSGIHGWINSNREYLGKSSNWIQFRCCLIQGTSLLNPQAALCFLCSVASFLVQYSARRGEDKATQQWSEQCCVGSRGERH